jgi:hypothetical protein
MPVIQKHIMQKLTNPDIRDQERSRNICVNAEFPLPWFSGCAKLPIPELRRDGRDRAVDIYTVTGRDRQGSDLPEMIEPNLW